MEQKNDNISTWKIMFGKYKNTTYDDLLKKDMKYVRWLLDNNIINNKCVVQYLNEKLETK